MNLFGLMIRSPGWRVTYTLAFVSVAVATFGRWLIDPILGDDHALILYYAALAVTAWYGGWRPALIALVIGYLAADWFFIPPRHDINIFAPLPPDLMRFATYFFSGVMIAAFSEAAKRAQRRAEINEELARNRERSLQLEIVERTRAENALRQSQDRLHHALDAARMVTWEWNREAGETVFSSNAGKVLGIPPPFKFFDPKRWWNWLHGDDLLHHKRTMLKAFAKRGSYISQFRLLRPDNGVLEWLEDHARVICDAAGKLVGANGVVMDVTERKLAEQEIEEGKKKLEKRVRERTAELVAANKELEAFSYSVSHDLRSPLRSIISSLELLAEKTKGALDAEDEEMLEMVIQGTRRMNELINDLLALARVSRTELSREPVNLSEMVQRITDRLHASQIHRAAGFIIEPNVVVPGDARLLEVALENLLNNAWKFSGNVPRTWIEFGAEEWHGRHVYFVRDNGAGFDMTYADKLFTPFQRLHADADFPGTGIGLATVRRIIDRHGGQIWAESIVNKGATFYFTLPNSIGNNSVG